jgi:hypothetical protein
MIPGITATGHIAVATGPTFRSASTVTTTSSSLTCPMPTGVISGDILIMNVWIHFDPKSGNNGDITYSGWTLKNITSNYSGDGYAVATYTKTAGSSESSFIWTGGINWYGGQMSIIAVSGATAVDVTSDRYSGYVTPSITTTTTTDLLLGVWVNWSFPASGLGTITKPASMTERVNSRCTDTAGTYLNVAIASEILSGSGATGTRTATVPNTTFYAYAMLLAVK